MLHLLVLLSDVDGYMQFNPESKVHMAHMGPTWVLLAPGRPNVGPMNLAIRVILLIPPDLFSITVSPVKYLRMILI